MFSSQRKRGTTTWDRDRSSPPSTPWQSGELNLDDLSCSGLEHLVHEDAKQEPNMEFGGGRLRTGEQRKKHNAIERRRKKAIKEAMQELLDLLPDKQTKPTQLTILRAAVDHIRELKQENEELRAQTGNDEEDGYSSGSRSIFRGRLTHKRRRKGSRSGHDGLVGSVSDDETAPGPGVDCSSPISVVPSFATPTDEIDPNSRGHQFVSIHDRVIADSIDAPGELLGCAPAMNTMNACITEALLSQLPDDAFSHESLTASSSSQASTMSGAEDDIEEVIAKFLIHND